MIGIAFFNGDAQKFIGQGVGDVFTPLDKAKALVEVVVVADGVEIVLRGDAVHIEMKDGGLIYL